MLVYDSRLGRVRWVVVYENIYTSLRGARSQFLPLFQPPNDRLVRLLIKERLSHWNNKDPCELSLAFSVAR